MNPTQEELKKIIDLIEASPLDETIKDILIRDLKSEGLTEFLREQIKAYCADGIKELDEEFNKAVQLLNQKEEQNPA